MRAPDSPGAMEDIFNMGNDELATATVGGGCFWCLEAVFKRIEGVQKVVSGYSGGQVENPSYRQVCSGQSGHAEVVQISFDPSVIGLRELLYIFFTIHDPTTRNRQGPDVGPQYRSVIFYHNPRQKEIAEEVVEELSEKNIYEDPIVTEISSLDSFYPAAENHQDYYERNKSHNYCTAVINPKLDKAERIFADKFSPLES
ncbi:MAG: peptide-methionine (S)-S-oxide reductase MsrA [bacterium]